MEELAHHFKKNPISPLYTREGTEHWQLDGIYRQSSICKSQRHFVSTAAAILKEVSLLRNFSPVTVFAYGVTALSVGGGGYFSSSSSMFDRFSL